LRPKALLPTRSRLSGVMIARLIGGVDVVVIVAATLAVVSQGDLTKLLAAPLGEILPLVVGCYMAFWTMRVGGAYDLGRREGLIEHLARVAMGAGAASAAALCFGAAMGAAMGVRIGCRTLIPPLPKADAQPRPDRPFPAGAGATCHAGVVRRPAVP